MKAAERETALLELLAAVKIAGARTDAHPGADVFEVINVFGASRPELLGAPRERMMAELRRRGFTRLERRGSQAYWILTPTGEAALGQGGLRS